MGIANKKWQIYLGGKMSGLSFNDMNTWRKDAKQKISDMAEIAGYSAIVINPVDFYNFENEKYQSQAEVMDYDLFHVKNSDFLIINADGLNSSVGTIMEIFCAWKNSSLIFVFGEYKNRHPWIERCVTRFEDDVDGVIDYLKEFYFI